MSEKKIVGTIVEAKGGYFLETSGLRAPRKKETVQIGSATQKAAFANLVGQEVEVILSEPIRSVIAVIGKQIPPSKAKCYIILCYKPVDGFMRAVDQKMIEPLAMQFYREGILSEANYKKVIGAF